MRYTTLLAGALGLSVAAFATPEAAGQDTTRTREVSTGAVESRIDNRGLSREQVRRLQTRLNEMGCEAGSVDGLIGPRTREAITCARQRENITGTDLAQLMRALGLEEAAGDVEPARRDTTARDTTMRQDTMMRHDTMMMRRDTTARRDTLGRDTTRLQRDTLRDTIPRVP
ncbi:MAG TPA: peptidoglycan-binding domain-containing protein, partial [Gemmatimonadaceae bacterium]|nr:peptidoglycan-binding domain-containing protein [Gemmatimonadaceae bacterium]